MPGYIFKTHQTLYSSTPPKFESFTRLSASGTVEKYLTGKGAEVTFTDTGEPSRRDVPQGAIVLSEREGGLWVLQVPGAGTWAKSYAANGRERNIDAKAEAMLARDLVRSASAEDRS
jgi:hypothetical protein